MATETKPATKNDKNSAHSSMFDAVLARLDVAAKLLGLSEDIAEILRHPQKEVKVSLPIVMDNGKIQVTVLYTPLQ
jgi:glutamate dehydrogenase (NAD(P)+)